MLSHMPTPTKGSARRVYLQDDELKALNAITEAVGLPQTEVLRQFIRAGIQASKEAGNRLPLPLKFAIIEPRPEVSFAAERPAPPAPKHRK